MKHTKESWELIYPKNVGSFEITVDGIVNIASVHNCYSNLEEQEANAKLIAQAPKMLQALILAESHIKIFTPSQHKNPELLEYINEAIKKATE